MLAVCLVADLTVAVAAVGVDESVDAADEIAADDAGIFDDLQV